MTEPYEQLGANLTPQQKLFFHQEYEKQNRSPSTALVLALLLGGLGAHRFYLRQWGWGIAYVLFSWTFIPLLVALVECFLIRKRTENYNKELAQQIIQKMNIIFTEPGAGNTPGAVEPRSYDGSRLAAESRDERECPYCAERILRKARVCKHCGHDVEPLVGSGTSVQTPLPAPLPTPPQTIVEAPPAKPRASSPAGAAGHPLVMTRAPQFRSISEPPGKMKFVAIVGAALILIVVGVWYFSHSLQHGPKKGEVRVNSKDGLKYVWIPPGTFMMGDNMANDTPVHQVTITKGFWLGQTEVTVGAYKRFAGATGRQMPPEPFLEERALNPGWGNEAMPIVNVTWDDAKAYCVWAGGRLPTEAEWEYAGGEGRSEERYGDLDKIAWYANNSGREPLDSKRIWDYDTANYLKRLKENGNNMHEVGQKRANGFGLYDMLGNVWEWVNDYCCDKNYYQNSTPRDPKGPATGDLRILCGQDWGNDSDFVLVSHCLYAVPEGRDYDTGWFHGVGFRCGGDVFAP